MNVVLLHPEIPENTGNIARLCAGTQSPLHLIRPMGFRLDEKRMKRAGLDYWPHVDLHVHDGWDAFCAACPGTYWFASTKGERAHYDAAYAPNDYLCFGSETSGLPADFYARYRSQLITIPMTGPIRSLNLANAVSIVLYEALRPMLQIQPKTL
ncbi:MAG: tRNA (uridine(34)/cytosine(34)/5-carboxymethylaminomethyluridine(34)-2'-O)-methyltransferase TrmL [Deltaproteobacteria bacterium CG11_big_fil_rev_8_21_14_0_20_47_16]|nr:MAG: tRNA (uridine(34)/cytosine(34)/5-carboxymethylaminomethyluridine(34)-2'-O)-methyltransferase TrmL [Deltaproteobacteria bacterium CG11_big_fil_rev_8_21_14_0_20_47_16]